MAAPVVIAKVTMAERLHNLHVKYLLHTEPDAYAFDGREYVCMRCVLAGPRNVLRDCVKVKSWF